MNKLISEEEVKRALDLDSFRNLSKDKIIEFVSMIPNMDKDVAISLINQFPEYGIFANNAITQLKGMCDSALESNNSSQKDAVAAYRKILDDLGILLNKEETSAEERALITDKMIEIADKISAKDSENKEFLIKVLKTVSPYVGGALVLGAAILGVNTKGVKLPTLKK